VRRPVVLLAVLLAALALGACRVDATLSVRVRNDGSGTVRLRVQLDPEAVAAAEAGGVSLEDRVRLDDLPAAGWEVRPWHRRPDGGAVLELRRPFDSPDAFRRVVAELNGDGGPLRSTRIRRSTDPVRTKIRFETTVDLPAVSAGVVDDQELAANLTAQRVDVAGLDASLTERIRDSLGVRVSVALPDGGTRTWTVAPDTRRVLAASSATVDVGRVVLVVVGAVLVVTALTLVLVSEWRARQRRREPPPVGRAS
jgi:hypothetical protein